MPNPEAPPTIVTDSTCDLNPATREILGIDVIPAKIMFGETEFTDGVDIDMAGFLAKLQDPRTPHPKTAAPGFEAFKPVYQAHEGPILSVHVSGLMSAFFNNSKIAARELGRTDITSFDSTTTSLGLGFLVTEAAKLSDQGYPVPEILPRLEDMRKRTYVVALADTLKYLSKSGRINLAQYGLGTMLHVNPILLVKDNKASIVDKPRTLGKAVPKLIQWVQEHAPFEKVGVVHVKNLDLAREVAAVLANDFPKDEILTVDLTPALAAHIGPGAIGVCFVEKAK